MRVISWILALIGAMVLVALMEWPLQVGVALLVWCGIGFVGCRMMTRRIWGRWPKRPRGRWEPADTVLVVMQLAFAILFSLLGPLGLAVAIYDRRQSSSA